MLDRPDRKKMQETAVVGLTVGFVVCVVGVLVLALAGKECPPSIAGFMGAAAGSLFTLVLSNGHAASPPGSPPAAPPPPFSLSQFSPTSTPTPTPTPPPPPPPPPAR